jgi:hypothetical protein
VSYFFFDRELLVSRFLRGVLLVVAAAMRLATFVLFPRFFADFLIFSYCRFRFGLFTPLGGIRAHLRGLRRPSAYRGLLKSSGFDAVLKVLRNEKIYLSADARVYIAMASHIPPRLENQELVDVLSRSLDLLEIQLEVIQGLISTIQELIERVHDAPRAVQPRLAAQREKTAPLR